MSMRKAAKLYTSKNKDFRKLFSWWKDILRNGINERTDFDCHMFTSTRKAEAIGSPIYLGGRSPYVVLDSTDGSKYGLPTRQMMKKRTVEEGKWRQRNAGKGKGEKGEKTIKSNWSDTKSHQGREQVGRKES